jgi:hypothetical protein
MPQPGLEPGTGLNIRNTHDRGLIDDDRQEDDN